MKSWAIHYKNKYPGCYVQIREDSLDVFQDGAHLLSLVKNGAGQWYDQSAELGLPERHDLSPIPKDSRVYKMVDGNIGFDDLSESRKELRSEFMHEKKVLSCEELSKKGFKFDAGQRVVERPSK